MTTSIALRPDKRNALLGHYRKAAPPDWCLRAHILLLLADGWTWATIAALQYTSSSTVARWQARFLHGRLPAATFPGLDRAGLPRGLLRDLAGVSGFTAPVPAGSTDRTYATRLIKPLPRPCRKLAGKIAQIVRGASPGCGTPTAQGGCPCLYPIPA
jgi:hypothetical protein